MSTTTYVLTLLPALLAAFGIAWGLSCWLNQQDERRERELRRLNWRDR